MEHEQPKDGGGEAFSEECHDNLSNYKGGAFLNQGGANLAIPGICEPESSNQAGTHSLESRNVCQPENYFQYSDAWQETESKSSSSCSMASDSHSLDETPIDVNMHQQKFNDNGESAGQIINQDEMTDTPNESFKIFVSNLPPGFLNNELMEMFQRYGEVVECEIFSKNYAFVHMGSEESGIEAMKQLHGTVVRGCKINVKKSVHNSAVAVPPAPAAAESTETIDIVVGTYKVHVGNLTENVTMEQVTDIFKPFGRVVEIKIYRNPISSAFVHMETEEGGKSAIAELNGAAVPDISTSLIVSDSKNPEGPSIPVLRLNVQNIAPTITATALRELFTPYGLILKAKINKRKNQSAPMKGFVLIEQFGNIRSALTDLNGKEVEGSKLVVEPYFEATSSTVDSHSPPKKSSKQYPPPRVPHSNNRLNINQNYERVPRGLHFNPSRPVLRPQVPFPSSSMRPPRMPIFGGQQSRQGFVKRHNMPLQPPPLPPRLFPNQFFRPTGFPQVDHDDQYFNNDDTYSDQAYNNDDSFSGQAYNNDFSYNEGFGNEHEYNEGAEDYNGHESYFQERRFPTNSMNRAAHPTKIPRNSNRTTPSHHFGNSTKQQSTARFKTQRNSANMFPNFPTTEQCHDVPPPLMSMDTINSAECDWSNDLHVSNFSQFSNDQDFTCDDELPAASTHAVPFDYSQIQKRKQVKMPDANQTNLQEYMLRNPNSKVYYNQSGKLMVRGNRGGKGKARRPGLGSAAQQKKAAYETGNQDYHNLYSGGPSHSQQIGDDSTFSSASPSPSYFKQSWPTTRGRQQADRKPYAKQIKDSEEDERRKYAEYLKQKPWLYQQIPGTVKRVQK